MNEFEENSFTGGENEQRVRFPDALPEEDFFLVPILQQAYRSDAENNARSLQRVWSHIASSKEDVQDEHRTPYLDDVRINALPPSHTLGSLPIRVDFQRRRQPMVARAQTLVAALVVVVLLGAFLALFATHDKGSIPSRGKTSGNQQIFPLPPCGAWSIVSSPSPGSAVNNLNSIAAVSANDMWAVGGSSPAVNGPFQPLIEHWNGSSWSVKEGPKVMNASLVGVVAISAHDVWAVGGRNFGGVSQPLIERWNGSSWSVVKSPLLPSGQNRQSFLSSITAVSPGDIWALGQTGTSNHFQLLIERWNGFFWSVVQGPELQDVSFRQMAVVSAHDIWAVGNYTLGSASQPLVEHWNGSSWSMVKSPLLPSGELNSVVVVSPNDIWAVGSFFLDLPFKFQTLIEHWNGSSWSIVKSPNPWPQNNELHKVTALSAHDIWAVGIYNTSQSLTKSLIEHWNGSSWSVVSSPSVKSTYLTDVARVPHTGTIWAVGDSFQFGGNSWRTFVEVYC